MAGCRPLGTPSGAEMLGFQPFSHGDGLSTYDFHGFSIIKLVVFKHGKTWDFL
jgi:hypothetical protein